MRSFARGVFAVAAAALLAPGMIEAQGRPVVAVLYFDNNSIGKDARDYDGVGKGIAELLINEMSQNPNLRVVERERVQALLVEQNMTKAGQVDAQTAIRLGKIIGAQYMVYGGFMSMGNGQYVLTGRATNVETSAIVNPVKIESRGDDVLGMINQLTTKLNAEMKLPALRVGEAGGAPAGTPASAASKTTDAPPTTTKAQANAPATKARPAAASKESQKMDIRTAMLYSKALEEEDAGNKTKAVELYRQVVAKFPEYAPAQTKIKKLSS